MSLFFLVGVIVNELCYLPWDFLNICKMLSSFLVQKNKHWEFLFNPSSFDSVSSDTSTL